MKPLKKSSAKNHRSPLEDPAKLAVEVAVEARKAGVRISTAEIVTAAELLSVYSHITSEPLTLRDYISIFLSSYAKRSEDEPKVAEAVNKVLAGRRNQQNTMSNMALIKRDLDRIKACFGSTISKAKLKTLMRDAEARQAYARLKLLGIIRQSRRGEYVVNEKTAAKIVESAVRTHGSVEKALAASIAKRISTSSNLIALLGTNIFDYLDPTRFSIDNLAKLYKLMKYEKPGRKYISKIIAEKIRRGEGTREVEEVYEILKREKLVDRDILAKLLEKEPRLSQKILRDYGEAELRDTLQQVARSSISKAVEAFSFAYSLSRQEKLALRKLLESGRNIASMDIGELERNAPRLSRLAAATEYLVKSLTDPSLRHAYLDMARAELDKLAAELDPNSLGEIAREYEALVRLANAVDEDPKVALKLIVRRMKPLEALRLLSEVASRDETLRRQATRLAYLLLRRIQLRSGLRSTFKKIRVYGGYGRIDVRRAVYNAARLNISDIARFRRAKRGRSVLVLDKSGSMREYAVYATLTAAALAPSITRLVLFDSKVTVVDNVEKLSLTSIVEHILSTSYEGYTNIVAALREAARGLSPSKLVLISDLRQTVKEEDKVSDVIRELSMKGWHIYIVAPPSVDYNVLSDVSTMAKSYIVSKPEEVARIASRIVLSK